MTVLFCCYTAVNLMLQLKDYIIWLSQNYLPLHKELVHVSLIWAQNPVFLPSK